MITDDEIMRLFELADPARDDDGREWSMPPATSTHCKRGATT